MDRGNGRQAIVLRLFARLTTFGFVLQALVVKEYLFADSPSERLAAIDASNRLIVEVKRRLIIELLRRGF